jgi:hypothetical protein
MVWKFKFYLFIFENLYQIGLGQQSKIFKSLSFFFLTIYSLGISKTTIKSSRPILLVAVTLHDTHRFLPIKILLFFNLLFIYI